MNMLLTLKNRQVQIVIALIGVVIILSGVLYYHRANIGSFIWYKFNTFPQLSLFLSDDPVIAVSIGNYYFNEFRNGVYDLEKAEHYFHKALEMNPEVYLAWFQLARIDFLGGDFYNALIKINKQISIHGGDQANVYYIRGLIYAYNGELEKAEVDFLKFLTIDEESWAAYNDLAWVYFRQGEYEKTKKYAQKGLEYHPSNPWLLTILGSSLINLGEKEEAGKVLVRALAGARGLTEKDWNRAYPGNDPRIAKQGLAEIIEAIEYNFKLAVD